MNITKLKIHYAQLGALGLIRNTLLEIARRVLDPFSRLSYAQVGEDIALGWFLSRESGFYVEVGCNHPQAYSNTYGLYKRGWRGICLDANPAVIEEFRRVRRRDTSICAAVSDVAGVKSFTQFVDPLISSLDAQHVKRWRATREVKAVRDVRTQRLEDILESVQAPWSFDLLMIDVEGHDYQVLLSLDLKRYAPKLIVIEMHGFDYDAPFGDPIYAHLVRNGYRLVGFLIMNGYFLRSEHEAGDSPGRGAGAGA